MMHFTRRELLKLTGLSVAGALVVACQPKATPEAAKAAAPTTAQPTEAAPAQQAKVAPKEVTQLIFWDQFGQEATAVDTIVNLFNEAHKDEVFVKRESQPNMRDILKTALSSGSGPDIMYYDTGPGFAGVLARAGLLLPIDDAYEEYGWNDKVIAWAKDRTAFDGKTYGIGHEIEFLGVFYNMRIYEEEGLTEPKTHDDYLTICETLKGKGYIPIAFGDQPKWPAYHEFSIFSNNIAGPSKVAAAISGEQPWNDPDFVQAIQMFFVDMRKAGYLTPDPNAVTYDDANLLFYNGQAGMTMTGTWMVADYTNPEIMPDPVGFYFYPSIQGKPIAPPAGLGSGY
ncbi:MAG: extracellular solute-binding protein, partial [Anaerolineales bacterium]